MKSFREYLAEGKVEDALALLNVDSSYDDAGLKLAFKRAASKAHPDKGGSDLKMKQVKSAYDLLSNTIIAKPESDYRSADAKYDEIADIILRTVDVDLNPQKYSDYFSKHLNKQFVHTREAQKRISGSMSNVSIVHTWETSDKKTKFILRLYVNVVQAKYARGLTNNSSAIFDTQVTPTTYVDGRKKVLKERFMRTNDSKFFDKPESVFTKASITSKKGNFTKKDMEFGLINRVGATQNGDNFYIPLSDGEHVLSVYRTTMMRIAQWNFGSIYKIEGRRKVPTSDYIKTGLLLETEELLETFIEITKTSDVGKITKLLQSQAYKSD